jgi:hypothetical protein
MPTLPSHQGWAAHRHRDIVGLADLEGGLGPGLRAILQIAAHEPATRAAA